MGYVNEKRLIYDIKEKKYLYGYKEKNETKSRKIWILTLFSYPFIKLVNDKFVLSGNITKLSIIVLSAIFILFMACKWRTIYGNDLLVRYKKQNFEDELTKTWNPDDPDSVRGDGIKNSEWEEIQEGRQKLREQQTGKQ